MGTISFTSQGSFDKTEAWLKRMSKLKFDSILKKYGQMGVTALASATPVESGLTASSWSYEVVGNQQNFTITWTNSHVVEGANIAILLQYGHGTGTGGYVQGRDYINPAIIPVFDKIRDELFREVGK